MATFGLDDSGYPPIDSNEFLELQIRSKLELDKLINGYVAMQRGTQERVDHAKTADRRNLLRGILVVSRVHKDEKGNGLLYWDKMLEYARMAVRQFNQEDVQRGG